MRHSRLFATGIGTAYVLTTHVPHPAELGRHLRSPRTWVAAVGPDAAAGATAGALLWLVAAWVAVGLAAGAVSLLPGALGRWGHAVACRVTPAAVRRIVITAAGTSILMSPVTAGAAPSIGAPAPPGSSSMLPPVGWPIDPALGRTEATAAGAGQAATPNHTVDRVTVRPGDSLWSLAAHRLGSGSPARIQAEWPRWYGANRRLIGNDPNLLRPGTSLRVPRSTGTDTAR